MASSNVNRIPVANRSYFPPNTVLWLKAKNISDPEYIRRILGQQNYDHIVNKYAGELATISDPNQRQGHIAQRVWRELMDLSERSPHVETKEQTSIMLRRFRDEWRNEKDELQRKTAIIEQGVANSDVENLFGIRVRSMLSENKELAPLALNAFIDEKQAEFMLKIYNIAANRNINDADHFTQIINEELDKFISTVPILFGDYYQNYLTERESEAKRQAAELKSQVQQQPAYISPEDSGDDDDGEDGGDGDAADNNNNDENDDNPSNTRLTIKMSELLREIDRKLCSICLVEYANDDSLTFFKCGHMFHASCATKWNKPSCPLCRDSP
jgi:hypothetical protein